MPQRGVSFTVPLMILLAVATATAQQRPSMTIESFRGVAWGVAPEAVIALFGEPEEDRALEGDRRMLAYRDPQHTTSTVIIVCPSNSAPPSA